MVKAWILFAVPLVVCLALFVGAAPAANRYPRMWLFADHLTTGQNAGIEFDWDNLDAAGDTERIVATIPSAYAVSLAHAVGTKLGTVTVRAAGGARYDGAIVEMSPAAFAASASAQACDPGAHPAIWTLDATSTQGAKVSIPVAVDKSAGGYRLTMCFDDEHSQNIELSEVDFYRTSGFTSPAHKGRYLFDSIVTPFASDGSPDTSSAYELRAYESFPRVASIKATYNPSNRYLTVTGAARTLGKRVAAGRVVDVSVNTGSTAANFAEIGTTHTAAGGTYLFNKALAKPPKFASVSIENSSYEACTGTSPAPAGCSSYTIDGVESGYVTVSRS